MTTLRPLITATPHLPARAGRRLLGAARRRPWVVATILVMVAFMACCVAMSQALGIPVRDPEGAILGKRMIAPFLFMGLFMLIDSGLRSRTLRATTGMSRTRALARTFADRWWWQRAVLACVGFMSFALTYLAYRNLKGFVSLYTIRTYGPELRALDEWFCFGHAPADLLQGWLGRGIAAHVLSSFYLAFIPLVPVSVAAYLAFASRMRDAYLYVCASMYCWILGTISYYMVPSLGPIWEAHWEFDQLPVTGVSRVQHALYMGRVNVSADPIGYPNIAGIGAFASLHVGVVVMAFLVLWRQRHRWIAGAVLVYGIPTIVSTMYFGWHYIADDIAGLFIGWFSVVSAYWTVYPRLGFLRLRRATARVGAGAGPNGDGEPAAPAPTVAP